MGDLIARMVEATIAQRRPERGQESARQRSRRKKQHDRWAVSAAPSSPRRRQERMYLSLIRS